MAEEELNLSGPDKPAAEPDSSGATDRAPFQFGAATPKLSPAAAELSIHDLISNLVAAPQESLMVWRDCELPSLGMYYGWTDGVISVRPMSLRHESILANQQLTQTGQAIDVLLQECTKFPAGFEAADLLLGDKAFLLFVLRGLTYGPVYEFTLQCPNCKQQTPTDFNLQELMTTVRYANPSLGGEPFRVDLPYFSQVAGRQIWVGVRFLRARDTAAVAARTKAKEKFRPNVARTMRQQPKRPMAMTVDNAIAESVENVIMTINGENFNRLEIRAFVDKMHALDSAAIREWLRENTPGIDSVIVVNCQHCGEGITGALPLTETFFRPAKSSGV